MLHNGILLVLQIRQVSFTSTVITNSVQFKQQCEIPNPMSDSQHSITLYDKVTTVVLIYAISLKQTEHSSCSHKLMLISVFQLT